MNWNELFQVVIQLAIFSIFITSIIEVVKGFSAVGIWGLIKGLVKALTKNEDMHPSSFPVLNFVIALLCCWAFQIGIVSKIFNLDFSKLPGIANFLDYFGTASIVYLGSDQLFKKFVAVKNQADAFTKTVTEIKTNKTETKTGV